MDGSIQGADPAQLRQLAKEMSSAATALRQVSSSLSAHVNEAGMWVGSDADRFRQRWNSQLRGIIANASKCVTNASSSLLANAKEQESTSSSGSLHGGGGHGGGHGGSGGGGEHGGNGSHRGGSSEHGGKGLLSNLIGKALIGRAHLNHFFGQSLFLHNPWNIFGHGGGLHNMMAYFPPRNFGWWNPPIQICPAPFFPGTQGPHFNTLPYFGNFGWSGMPLHAYGNSLGQFVNACGDGSQNPNILPRVFSPMPLVMPLNPPMFGPFKPLPAIMGPSNWGGPIPAFNNAMGFGQIAQGPR